MNEVGTSSTPPRPNSASPPPKCAICLGTCTNKCFSDSCMHQFCFTCLLEWSKVKAECPLCKQPFKSIIHNIKSNDEYEEHFIAPEVPDGRGLLDNDEFLYLPPAPSRHFQFRTTFTVDPGGELAIQQMLLSHPLTNTLYNVPDNYILPRQRYGRPRHTRRASSATSFRKSIYMLNLWVYAPPDITGRYRDVTPHFYRDNPAARNRLVPWLNRELNALLRENTQQVMHLVDVIMDHLPRWHIRSRSFRQLLSPYLTNKTDHFIHEFYNFMRSPYDMIGYDRHIVYTDRPHSPTYLISDREDDSDVAIVNISEPVAVNNNPFRRPTIEVIEIDSDTSRDSDVIIGEPPTPEVVLVDSDSDDVARKTPEELTNINSSTNNNNSNNNNVSEESEDTEVNRKPILPLKIRLKRKRQSREKRSRNKKRSSKRYHSSTSRSRSSSTSSDSSDSSTTSNASSRKHCKRRHKYKKSKSRSHKDHKSRGKEKSKSHIKTAFISDSSSDNEPLSSRKRKMGFDSDDNVPLSKIKSKELKKKSKKSRTNPQGTSSRPHTITSRNSPSSAEDDVPQNTVDDAEQAKPSCSRWKSPEVGTSTNYEHISSSLAPVKPSTPSNSLPSTSNAYDEYSYRFPDSMSQFKYEQYNPYVNNSQNGSSLPQFENIPHYDTFQQYAQYRTPRYSPSPIGNRYYDGPDYRLHRNTESYTPPLAHNSSISSNTNSYNNPLYRSECACGSSHRECSGYNCEDSKLLQFYQPQNMEIPSRVNVGVGTSPIKNEIGEPDYSNYCGGPCSSRRMQSVIVKKEEKENPHFNPYYLNTDTSDTDG